MVITPPPDNEPPPKEVVKIEPVSSKQDEHIKKFLAVPSRMCSCGLVNHGWNKRCYCGRIW